MANKRFLSAVAATLLLGACSASSGGTATDTSTVAGKKVDPQELTRDMQKNMHDIESGAFDSSFELSLTELESKESLDVDMSLKGKHDARDESDMRVELDLDAEVAGNIEGMEADSSVSLSMVAIDSDAYLKLVDLTLPTDVADAMEMIEPYMGTWYMFSGAVDMAKTAAEAEAGPVGIADAFAGENATPEQKEAVKNLLENTDFFETTVDDATVDVGGVNTYKVSVKLDRPGIVEFVKELADIHEEELSASDISDLEDGLKEVEFDGVLYIGVDDKMLYRVTGSLSPTSDSDFVKEMGNFTFTIDANMSDFNEDQGIVAPAGAVEFDPESLPL